MTSFKKIYSGIIDFQKYKILISMIQGDNLVNISKNMILGNTILYPKINIPLELEVEFNLTLQNLWVE